MEVECIEIAEFLDKYSKRKQRGKESIMNLLQKHKKAIELLEKGYMFCTQV